MVAILTGCIPQYDICLLSGSFLLISPISCHSKKAEGIAQLHARARSISVAGLSILPAMRMPAPFPQSACSLLFHGGCRDFHVSIAHSRSSGLTKTIVQTERPVTQTLV